MGKALVVHVSQRGKSVGEEVNDSMRELPLKTSKDAPDAHKTFEREGELARKG